MSYINKPYFRSVVQEVSDASGVPVEVIMGASIQRRHARARNLAMRALRLRGYSLPVIGDFFGRHHSTVFKNIKRLEARYKK